MADQVHQPTPLLAPAGDPSEPASSSRSLTRKKASTACSACRSRRSKCTGGVPCLSCISHRTECIKDESEDGRRRVAIKRKVEGLEEDRHILANLITVLKHDNNSRIESLLNLVRTSASRQDLNTFLDHALKDSGHSARVIAEQQWGNDTAVDVLHKSRRPRTGGISDLINPPIQVPASPWTNVTDDDDFVSHLLSLWFTWIHPWFHWIEADAFIAAMQTQDLNNHFCTPYLVSSILSEACLLDALDGKDNSYDNRFRERFFNEAKAGIEAEKGRTSLALIQAMGVQWTNLHLAGEDKLARVGFNSQMFMAKDLGKWRAGLSKDCNDQSEQSKQIDESLSHVWWTISVLDAFNLSDYYHSQSHTWPRQAQPGSSHETTSGVAWSPYPQHRTAQSRFHPDCHFRALTWLAEALSTNEKISARRIRGKEQHDELGDLLKQLKAWPDQLPDCMNLHASAIPHVLMLHALHNWVLLVLAKQAAAAEAGSPAQPVITTTPPSQHGQFWQKMSMSCAISIGQITDSYSRSWTSDYFPAIIMQPVSLALLTLMEDLDFEDARSAFVALSRTLCMASRKFPIGLGVMQVVHKAGRAGGVILPDEALHLFDGERTRSSQSSIDEIGMNYLLEKWNDLDLDTETE